MNVNVQQVQTQTKLFVWPTPQEYNEAIQNLGACFADLELKSGSAELTALGLPRPITGAFASVYRIRCGKHDWAVRCFLYNFPDQQERYGKIAEALYEANLPYTVEFYYEPEGIRLHGKWYPILKMGWVDGPNLNHFIEQNLLTQPVLQQLAERFKTMVAVLKRSGIAHGDLQHGNILIINDDYKLVDYDGMYVPALGGYTSNELGHRNYQHPKRTKDDFGPDLDNFSAWVIYTSLLALSIDGSLWKQLNAGDECLLFRSADFVNPLSSLAFSILEHHSSAQIVKCARLLRSFLDLPVISVPDLDLSLAEPSGLEALAKPSELRAGKAQGPLPDWMHLEPHHAAHHPFTAAWGNPAPHANQPGGNVGTGSGLQSKFNFPHVNPAGPNPGAVPSSQPPSNYYQQNPQFAPPPADILTNLGLAVAAFGGILLGMIGIVCASAFLLILVFVLCGAFKHSSPTTQQTFNQSAHIQAAENLSSQAADLYKEQKYAEAAATYQRALEEYYAVPEQNKATHDFQIRDLSYLSYSDVAQKQYGDAEKAMQEAAAMQSYWHGENNAGTATLHNDLGVIYYYQRKFDLAKSEYEKALSARKAILPANSPDIAGTLHSLALTDQQLHLQQEAKPQFKQVHHRHKVSAAQSKIKQIQRNDPFAKSRP